LDLAVIASASNSHGFAVQMAFQEGKAILAPVEFAFIAERGKAEYAC
jgi:hypothetical protein